MASKPTAGELFYRAAFDKPLRESDGAGGVLNGFGEQFQMRVALVHLRGGEGVLAARLEGTHAQVVRVRRCAQVDTVTTDWRIRDTRTGEVFNIRDITPGLDRQFVDMLCERGVAV